jgi:hypothetical protein
MLFKLRHTTTAIEIELRTESDDPDQIQPLFVQITKTGNDWVDKEVERSLLEELSNSRGVYGHLVDPLALTNADLSVAISHKGMEIAKLPSFEITETQVVTPQPLPEGALS